MLKLKRLSKRSPGRLGADKLSTPREVVRDFISILNILHQNPHLQFEQFMQKFQPTVTTDVDEDSEFAEFTL